MMMYSQWNPDPCLEDDPYDAYVEQLFKLNRVYGYQEVPMSREEFEKTKRRKEEHDY